MDQAVEAPTLHRRPLEGQQLPSWAALLATAFVLVIAVNPVGFVGGGWDDWQYLMSARCWAEHGACLPTNHWEGRWPVFAPIAAIFALIGESRISLSIWPLLSSIAALSLLVVAGNKALGRPMGWIGALLFLVTPAFSIQILAPSVEALELAFILGGVCCILWWNDRRSVGWAFSAGLCFGFALQVRETALVAVLIAGIWVATKRPRLLDIGIAAAGFSLPLAGELLTYGIATGDPLFRRHLALAHTQIPSAELLGPIDSKRPPFFNPVYIANWRHEPGLHVHWLIDGFLNLLINAKAGLSLGLTPLLLLVGRSAMAQPEWKKALVLWGLSIAYAAVLIYALAIDPKARMMFVPLTASCLALALILANFWWAGKRQLSIVVIVAHTLAGLTILFIHQRTDIVETTAAEWLARYPGQIEIDANTRRHLALVDGAEQLPGVGSHKGFLLYSSRTNCAHWLGQARLPGRQIVVERETPTSRKSMILAGSGGWLCLFQYRRAISVETIRRAITSSAAMPARL